MLGNMSSGKRQHRKRTPKLSDKPEPGSNRYYASYRDENGKSRRKRFTRDRQESERPYDVWIKAYEEAIVPSRDHNTVITTSWTNLAMQLLGQVWAHLEDCPAKVPRKPDELLFVTRNGLPVSYTRTKTPQELGRGDTNTRPEEGQDVPDQLPHTAPPPIKSCWAMGPTTATLAEDRTPRRTN